MGTCIIIPTIEKNGKEYDSKLFNDLKKNLNNRDITIAVYSTAIALKDEFKFNELDDLGEPTFDSVVKKLDLINLFKSDLNADIILENLNLKKDGEIVYSNSFEGVYDKIKEFNKEKKDRVVIIKSDNNGYYGELVEASNENINNVEQQEYLRTLNSKLRIILNNLGFDVSRIDTLTNNGVFSPEDAEKNAEGLIDIIKLAKGLSGDYTFSEEFSHFFIAGMKNNELVKRLFNLIDDNAVKEILGEQYEDYRNKYVNTVKNDFEINQILKEEVIGKLLAEKLNTGNVSYKNNTLWDRFENYIKSNFRNKDEQEIIDLINNTKKEFEYVASLILDNDEEFINDFNSLNALASKTFYNLDNNQKYSQKFIDLNKEIVKVKAQKKQLYFTQNSLKSEDTFDEEKQKIDSELRKAEVAYNEEDYEKNCWSFLNSVQNELKHFFKEESKIIDELSTKQSNKNHFVKIGRLCKTLNTIKDFIDVYDKVTEDLANCRYEDNGLTQSAKDEIADFAIEVRELITQMKKSYPDLRYDLLFYWLKTYYWETDKQFKDDNGEMFTLTLESMLRMAPKDINFIDTYISEMGHCSDPLLNLISTINKKQMARRDQKLEDMHIRLANIYKNLGGGPTDFVFELNENGKLTGNIKSEYNFKQYNKEYKEYAKKLKDEGVEESEIPVKLKAWRKQHRMKVLVDKKNKRYEYMPNINLFPQYRINNWDAGMTAKQKEYYNEMLEIKAEMETLIGFQHYHLYLAPQVSTDYFQAVTSRRGVKNSVNAAAAKLKTTLKLESNDTEFGEINEKGEKVIVKNMHGEIIKKIPVYFVNRLSDMDRLCTDFTKSMSAYCAMSYNYSEMGKIINQLELLKEHVLDRQVKQFHGDKPIVNNIMTGIGLIKDEYTKSGKDTNIGERIEKYYEMNFYGMQKEEGKIVNIWGYDVSFAKFLDLIKDYSGIIGLGVNAFSGASNIAVGEVQLLIEAMANTATGLFNKGEKHSFGLLDLLKATLVYLKEIPFIMAEQGNPLKNNYLSLLMRKYDTEQTFFEDIKNNGYYNNRLERIVGNNSLTYFLQNGGEHYLHGIIMIAMLKSKKVLVNGQKMSLYDAYKVEGNKLVEKGEIRELDGTKFTNNKFIDEKLRIQEFSHQFNGAFSAEDLGSCNQKAWARLVAQFRQWMPGHYGRRFASKFVNTATAELQEGYWQTVYKLSKELLHAIKHKDKHIRDVFFNMTTYQKVNTFKALSELVIMFGLSLLIKGAFGDDDDDDEIMSRANQFYKYQLKRTYMEMMASMPIFPKQMYENAITMVQSPMASIKATNNLINLLCLWNLGNEIESGKYTGWSVYRRDAYLAAPYLGNIKKYYDLAEETYMFNIFPE